MPNKKHHSKNKNYPVPQLRVASINIFPKEGKIEFDDHPGDIAKSPGRQPGNKTSSDLPEFYEAKIKPKNFDPL
jgi:hypothetical protein